MWSFKKSPRPEELSTLTRTASFRCVLKPMASRSARVLGRSLGGHVYVISPPSRPNMYVVPAGERKEEETAQKENVSSPFIQYEDLAVNTGTLLLQQIQYLCCVRGAQAACSVSLCWIIPLQSAEQHITLEQLSAPIWGLKHTSVISPAQENSFKIRKAGSGSAFPIMLCNYSDLLPQPGSLVGRNRMWMLANFRSCPQCPGKLPNWHLFVSRASLAVSKADAAGCIIDWAVQLCPSSDLQTIHFLFYCTTSPCDGFDHDLGDGRVVLIIWLLHEKGPRDIMPVTPSNGSLLDSRRKSFFSANARATVPPHFFKHF